jgi:hypothetical protein
VSNPTCQKGCKYVDDYAELTAQLSGARSKAVELARMIPRRVGCSTCSRYTQEVKDREHCANNCGDRWSGYSPSHRAKTAAAVIEEWGTK